MLTVGKQLSRDHDTSDVKIRSESVSRVYGDGLIKLGKGPSLGELPPLLKRSISSSWTNHVSP